MLLLELPTLPLLILLLLLSLHHMLPDDVVLVQDGVGMHLLVVLEALSIQKLFPCIPRLMHGCKEHLFPFLSSQLLVQMPVTVSKCSGYPIYGPIIHVLEDSTVVFLHCILKCRKKQTIRWPILLGCLHWADTENVMLMN